MNYEEAMNFIQNTSKFGSVLGLDNIKELLERLGNPQDPVSYTHLDVYKRQMICCTENSMYGIRRIHLRQRIFNLESGRLR